MNRFAGCVALTLILAVAPKAFPQSAAPPPQIVPEDSRKIDIPDGVRYRYAAPEINARSRPLVLALFKASPRLDQERSSVTMIMAGPGLMHGLKDPETLPGNLVEFHVPNLDKGGKPIGEQVLPGKLIKNPAAIVSFWKHLDQTWPAGPAPTIRKLNREELRYYWAIITYDIEEPVWIVESGRQRFLVDAIKTDPAFFFIDNTTDVQIVPPADATAAPSK